MGSTVVTRSHQASSPDAFADPLDDSAREPYLGATADGASPGADAPGLAVMVHLLGSTALTLASLTAGVLLLLLGPSAALAIGVLLGGPAAGALWFRRLLRATDGRRSIAGDEEADLQAAAIVERPVRSAAPTTAALAHDNARTRPLQGAPGSLVALG